MGWQFFIDRGGTFTDIVASDPDGEIVTHKLLSADPERYTDAAVAGIRSILRLPPDVPIPSDVDIVRMGTTVATNALLERTGEPTALVITAGFADALQIGYQNRPRIFDRHIDLPGPLYDRVIEIDERVTAEGQVLTAPDDDAVERQLRAAHDDGIRAVAVVLLHSHLYPEHERRVAAVAERIGFDQVSRSSEVSPLMKVVGRGQTTVVDAYLSPVLRRYVDLVAAQTAGRTGLMFMQSNGGLTEARLFRGKDAILSGPAGGIVGMAKTSAAAGYDKVIGFDMGGTSTDVSHYAGSYERVFDTTVGGVRLQSPMLEINTVAAGGGSVLHFDGARYRVGPDSAGADPGPACYRNGGPLTVTDANVLLGRIRPEHFPHVFGPDGDQPLDVDTVREQFAELAGRITTATGDDRSAEEVAAGYLRIAVANMANAVKRISVAKGHDVTRYALTTFGGAGGQHACAVADALGIDTVLVPPMAGVLSALGIGLADTVAMRQTSVELPLSAQALPQIVSAADELAVTARQELADSDVAAARITVDRRVHLRYDGTDTIVDVSLADVDAMVDEFERRHRELYSFLLDRPLIAEAVAVEAVGASTVAHADSTRPSATDGHAAPVPHATVPMWTRTDPHDAAGGGANESSAGKWQDVALYRRIDLHTGDQLTGPAIITEDDSTTVVDAGWRAQLAKSGHLVVIRARPRPAPDATAAADPVLLEIFNNLFMSIAEQMGTRLAATAQSVNIKERLDFSCALFDPDGNLIANAPHIPVHLGSMGTSVKEVIRRRHGQLRRGDVYAVNDPYHGGTHLPDVTVITPVFAADSEEILFYVASRGHHAEIGGITPGSMPAHSRDVHEEGVLFDNWLLAAEGEFREAQTRRLLTDAPYPSRDPDTNLADLRAQIAANTKGVEEVGAMIEAFGLDVVQAYMRHVQDNAEEAVRTVLDRLSDGSYTYELDSGARIVVTVAVDRAARTATLDFTGTSPQSTSNFNAPSSVVSAAVLYVFRTLVGGPDGQHAEIPLNDGCLRPLRIVIEEGSMLAPQYPTAVVAGNVETSQAVTGALYAALGVQAEGAGTMNNVTFGNERCQYYETLASGSGAGDGFAGTPVVQTHMTNSRLTDPEVLEWRLPVLVDSFAVRRGSGGAGRWHGGDGAVRRLQFREDVTVSLLTGHRRVPPYGMSGGSPGALGRNAVQRADGTVHELPGCGSATLAAGDVLVIETPGGGGYGTAGGHPNS